MMQGGGPCVKRSGIGHSRASMLLSVVKRIIGMYGSWKRKQLGSLCCSANAASFPPEWCAPGRSPHPDLRVHVDRVTYGPVLSFRAGTLSPTGGPTAPCISV